MGIDPGILFPFGDHVDSNGNLKAGGKGILRYLYPFGGNVDSDGNVKPRGGGKLAGGYYGPGGNSDGSGQGQAQQKPGIGPYQGHTPGLPRPSQPTDERTTTNANGVTQTMRAMSSTSAPIDMARSFDSLLEAQGSQPFGSNQLPTTAGSPDSKVTPKTDQAYTTIQPDNPVFAEAFGQDLADKYKKGTSYTTIQPDDPQFAAAFGQDLADKNTKAKTTGYTKGGRLDQALAGVKTQEANRPMTPERRRAAASMAFYNADNVMDGLKARDAVNDVVYAGGQHYGRGALSEDAGIGDKYKIDRADARDIASGKQTAAGLLESYKSRITESTKKSTPAEQQEPNVLEEGAKDGSFKQDKPMFPGTTRAIEGAVEFDSNNDKTLPTFGNNGGYKSGFKRIDTSMTNPFG